MNQDNDRISSNGGYNNMNRGYENHRDYSSQSFRGNDEDRFGGASSNRSYSAHDESNRGYGERGHDSRTGGQRSAGGYDDNRTGSQRSFGGYDDNRSSNRSFGGYDDNRYTGTQGSFGSNAYGSSYGAGGSRGYRGTDDRSQRSYGYDDRGFGERHPHDEHERGRWGSDYEGSRGHRYAGGMIDDDDRHRRDEARQQYRDHDRGQTRYQDRDDRGRFTDTGEGRSFDQRHRGYDDYRGRTEQNRSGSDDHRGQNRFGSDDTRRYGHPGYGYEERTGYAGQTTGGHYTGSAYGGSSYGGGYGRDEQHRGRGSDYDMRGPRGDDHDRRWTGGGYEEDRRGRGRGRY